MLKEWVPGDHVLAIRNPHFHDRRNVRLNGVLYRPVADLGAGLRLFQTGELDTLTNFPPERLEWLKAHMPRELRLAPSLGVTVYVFNHRLEKFRDPRVRRALSLAIDRDLLTTRIVRSGDRPAHGLIPAGLPGHAAPSPRPPHAADADRAEARRLLGMAGYDARHPLELELLYHTSEEHRKVAVAVASMWRSVGVHARLRNAERQVVEVASRNGEFQVVRAAWFSSYADPMGLFAYLRAGNPANAGAYRLAAFDATLERADAAAAGTRAQLLRQAEQLVMADQAVIPLYFLVSRRLVATRVVGWRDDNLTALRPARWLALR
jgi:oligopeptide transport system substrate-binding protein